MQKILKISGGRTTLLGLAGVVVLVIFYCLFHEEPASIIPPSVNVHGLSPEEAAGLFKAASKDLRRTNLRVILSELRVGRISLAWSRFKGGPPPVESLYKDEEGRFVAQAYLWGNGVEVVYSNLPPP